MEKNGFPCFFHSQLTFHETDLLSLSLIVRTNITLFMNVLFCPPYKVVMIFINSLKLVTPTESLKLNFIRGNGSVEGFFVYAFFFRLLLKAFNASFFANIGLAQSK